MSHRQIIQQRLDAGKNPSRGTRDRESVQALQHLLHELGFDTPLNWERYGADGDYGTSTENALRAFAERNNLRADGRALTPELARELLRRYDGLEHLRLLCAMEDDGRVEQRLYLGTDDSAAVASLQAILEQLGFGIPLEMERYRGGSDYGDGTRNAVQAFANQADIASDGRRVTRALGERLIGRFRAHLGPDWQRPRRPAAPSVASADRNEFGARQLSRNADGAHVEELQLRLAGFRGTVWDGGFGPGTEMQVTAFQRDYMEMASPTGEGDDATYRALEEFARDFPIDFARLECACGQCGGFGQGRFREEYREGSQKIEAYHRYEYPGIHRAILHAYRGAWFYARRAGHGDPMLTCGYRCWIDNEQKGRRSTNHMGKALDIDFPLRSGEDKRDDANRCDQVRGLLVEQGHFQIGWAANNRKALEPSRIAPTWIHMDVRCFAPRFLEDRFFVKSLEELDRRDLQAG